MKRYLVTGGAGFIGSHIVRALLSQGESVRVLDNFSSGKPENLTGLDNTSHAGRLEVLEGDVRDLDNAAEAVEGVEVVFHEAAFVSVPESMEKPAECFEVNVTGTSVLFESARRAGVRRAVIASSAAVYGNLQTLPLEENSEPQPLSPYAVSKRVDEMYGALYNQSFGLEVVALRYFNVYGPRQRPDSMYAAAVPIFIRCLRAGKAVTVFGDGGQTRDLVYVGDVVHANLIAAEHPAAAGEIFNICSGHETRVLDLVNELNALFPTALPPIFAEARLGDIYKSVGSPEKARKLIEFTAGTSLRAGLRETLEWR
jgi:nucleoside-diphosphate-sugar epimerase